MQNHELIKTKLNLFLFFYKMKFATLNDKLIEIFQTRQHKGRLLTRDDFATGPTPKKINKTREI